MTDKIEVPPHDFLVELAEFSVLTDKSPQTCAPDRVLAPRPSTAYRGQRNKFIAVAICQLLALTGLAGAHAFTLLTGREVVLHAVPVDPWDMFRGTYERLSYDISEVPCNRELHLKQEVFVVLRNSNGVWQFDHVAEKQPQLGPDEVSIKARVSQLSSMGKVHLRYGIEQYYEAEGLPSLVKREGSNVIVAVDSFGNAAIKQIGPIK